MALEHTNPVKVVSQADVLSKPLPVEVVDFVGIRRKGFFKSLALYEKDPENKGEKDSFSYIYEVVLIWCGAGRVDVRELEAWAKERTLDIETVLVLGSEEIEMRVQPVRRPSDPIKKEAVLTIERSSE